MSLSKLSYYSILTVAGFSDANKRVKLSSYLPVIIKIQYDELKISDSDLTISVGDLHRSWHVEKLENGKTKVMYVTTERKKWIKTIVDHPTSYIFTKLIKKYFKSGTKVEHLHISGDPVFYERFKLDVPSIHMKLTNFKTFREWLPTLMHNQFKIVHLELTGQNWKLVQQPLLKYCDKLIVTLPSVWNHKILRVPHPNLHVFCQKDAKGYRRIFNKYAKKRHPVGWKFFLYFVEEQKSLQFWSPFTLNRKSVPPTLPITETSQLVIQFILDGDTGRYGHWEAEVYEKVVYEITSDERERLEKMGVVDKDGIVVT